MTKSELMSILTEKQSHLSYKHIERAVREMFDSMSKTLAQGGRIEIRGFGSFSLRYRAARYARNPRTGEPVTTKGKYAVHFKPGKELRERVNVAEEETT